MAPIKQEEQMKDKLEKRSLQPSADSWANLANRLDAQEKSKKASLAWWFGVAASIVGILFVTTMYFNNQSVEHDPQIIVNSEENVMQEINQNEENQLSETKSKSKEVIAEPLKFNENIIEKSSAALPTNVVITQDKSNQENIVTQEVITHVERDRTKESNDTINELKTTSFSFEEEKIQEVVAQINTLKTNGISVTETEIDSLLERAQKEILSNRLCNENTRTVDAKALLQDVEDDLQQSFRSKVFEALQSGYESVKTAVAERNN
ncbi:MAG: hypothetical protein ACSHXF_05650 [Aquaticitalea sp.]